MAKNYEIIRENGKIADIKVNGKPVKRGFMRGIRKAQETTYWQEFKNEGTVTNPFSGVPVELNALERTIASWCQNWYYYDYLRNPMNTQAPVQTYDDMKYFLLDLNSQAYSQLLD
jgi:hypothetical protein